MKRQHQTSFGFEDQPRVSVPRKPTISTQEKLAQRAAQDYKCATCGGVSKGGAALDVVRWINGKLVAFCRRHRLQADAYERCRKGVLRRRRITKPRPIAGQKLLP